MKLSKNDAQSGLEEAPEHDHDHDHEHEHSHEHCEEKQVARNPQPETTVAPLVAAEVDRRTFIKQLFCLGAGVSISSLMSPTALLPMAQAQSSTGKNRIVYIFLRGAADALSFVRPRSGVSTIATDYNFMASTRSNIIEATNALPFSNVAATNFSVNDSFLSLINAHNGVMIFGMGSTDKTRSHFSQQDNIEYNQSGGAGMLTKFLNATNRNGSIYEALCIGAETPLSIGKITSADKTFTMRGFSDFNSIRNIDRGDKEILFSNGYNPIMRIKDWWTERYTDQFAGLTTAATKGANAGYGSSDIGNKLKAAFQMISSYPNDNRAVALDMAGWDHHTNINTNFGLLGGQLSTALNAFCTDLKTANVWNDTTIMVMTEFGRKVNANSAKGADHGRGGVGILLGGKVNSSTNVIFNKTAALPTLFGNDDGAASTTDQALLVGTDFRAVMNSIFKHMNNNNAVSVFSGYSTSIPGLFTS